MACGRWRVQSSSDGLYRVPLVHQESRFPSAKNTESMTPPRCPDLVVMGRIRDELNASRIELIARGHDETAVAIEGQHVVSREMLMDQLFEAALLITAERTSESQYVRLPYPCWLKLSGQ